MYKWSALRITQTWNKFDFTFSEHEAKQTWFVEKTPQLVLHVSLPLFQVLLLCSAMSNIYTVHNVRHRSPQIFCYTLMKNSWFKVAVATKKTSHLPWITGPVWCFFLQTVVKTSEELCSLVRLNKLAMAEEFTTGPDWHWSKKRIRPLLQCDTYV